MSSKWYSKKWVTVVLHTAVWVLLFSLPYLLRPAYNENEAKVVQPEQVHRQIFGWTMNITWVIFFYFNAYVLIPRLLNRKKYGQFVVLLFLVLTWIISQGWFLSRLLLQPGKSKLGLHILFNFFIYLLIFASGTAYRLIIDKMESEKRVKEKENEYLKTELSLLRSQVSPHFMFNVLNNMVALARKKSDLLEPSLLKFSSLMRYMLYEADEEKVPLEKEIDYLHSYIDLQQQRFGKNIIINANLQSMDDVYEIEPMLLIPFVENAFKHGTGMIDEAQITIQLKAEKGVLDFRVQNKYDPSSVEVKDKTSGIGLANVKRRLNLLYGDKQNLLITKKDNWFTISLQLNLN